MILMKEEIRKRWVEALRSGYYKKGEGSLYNSDTGKHCALGVLCELAVEDGVVDRMDFENGGPSVYGSHDGSTSDNVLPSEVVEWAGLESESPIVSFHSEGFGDTEFWSVSEMNDLGASYEYIADKIESEE